jgi:5-methylcytosine-specific restriction endonuclease McrA
MTSGVLQSTLLVLDKQYSPVEIRSIQEALPLLYVGKALAMAEDYTVYDMDGWITYSELHLAEDPEAPRIVRSPSISLLIPEVIVLKDYIKNSNRFRKPRCNRHSIFRRDAYTCQYCHKKFSRRELEIDHVVPQSKGGPTSWTNCVTSCKPCNSNKGDKSVEQMGYTLLKTPIQPTWKQLFDRSDKKKLWEAFLK